MIFKIAWRNIWRNKKRTLISTLSISGALFLVILMRSMQFGFYDNIIDQVVNSYSGYIQVHADGYWEKQSVNNSMELDDSLINKISSVEGVDNVSKRLQTFSLVSKGDKSKGAIINGIEIEKEQLIIDWDKKIIKGIMLTNILGIIMRDKPIGIAMLTLNSLKKFISSKRFIIKPKATNIKIILTKLFKNSLIRYLLSTKFFIFIFLSFQIKIF